MTRIKVGRPRNRELKTGFYLALVFKQLATLERAAFFLGIHRGKHCNRNDVLLYCIDTLLTNKVKETEKLYTRYQKQQATKELTVTNKGFREWLLAQKKEEVNDDNEKMERPTAKQENGSIKEEMERSATEQGNDSTNQEL